MSTITTGRNLEDINLIFFFAKYQKLILSVWMIVIIATVLFISLSPTVYKREFLLGEPSSITLESLSNKTVLEINYLPERIALTSMVFNLQNSNVRQNFAKEYPDPQYVLSILSSMKTDHFSRQNNLLNVSVKGEDKKELGGILQKFVKYAGDCTTADFLDEEKDLFSSKIGLLRQVARRERLDRILILKEAYDISSKLGWVNPVKEIEQDKTQNPAGKQLYLLGSKALSLEIKSLENRQSDDPYIPKIAILKEKLLQIKNKSGVYRSINVYKTINSAKPPEIVKPNRYILSVLGIAVGFILAMVLAYVKYCIDLISSASTEVN